VYLHKVEAVIQRSIETLRLEIEDMESVCG
jgi:hypothetical protein